MQSVNHAIAHLNMSAIVTPGRISKRSKQACEYEGSKEDDADARMIPSYFGLVASSQRVLRAPSKSETVEWLFGTFNPTTPLRRFSLCSDPSTGIDGSPGNSCISGDHKQSSRSNTIMVGSEGSPLLEAEKLLCFILTCFWLFLNKEEDPARWEANADFFRRRRRSNEENLTIQMREEH